MDNPDMLETQISLERIERIHSIAEKIMELMLEDPKLLNGKEISPTDLLAAFALGSASLIASFPSVVESPLKGFLIAKGFNELFAKTLGEMLAIVVTERAHAKASEA